MNDLPKLESDELDALEEVGRGLMRKKISGKHREKLLKAKLISEKLGGDTVTDKGKMVLLKQGRQPR